MNNLSTSIATSREQSERLLSIGLNPETADMTYHYTKSSVKALEWELKPYPPTLKSTTKINIDKLSSPLHKRPDGSQMTGEEVFESIWGKDVPAWSLSRLISMMPKCIVSEGSDCYLHICYHEAGVSVYYDDDWEEQIPFLSGADILSLCIDMIEWLIDNNHFDKEYLKLV